MFGELCSVVIGGMQKRCQAERLISPSVKVEEDGFSVSEWIMDGEPGPRGRSRALWGGKDDI